jgi:hypothetical protein
MTDQDELGRALVAIADAFDALGVTWAIGGSLASAAHGEPRATNDIDIVATLDEAGARRLPELLGADFYADAEVAVEATRRRASFNVIDQRSFIKIDVFVPPAGPLGTGQLSRREMLEVLPGMRALPVLGPEDVVLQKLRWYRLGGEVSERQWRDILSVLRFSKAEIDDTYLDAVALPEGLGTLLERARREGGSP